MNITTLSLFAVELLSIGVIFWLIPDAVARLVKGRLSESGPRPIRLLVDQLPGLVTGTVFGAVVLYLTGMSYEKFVVNTGRTIGDAALEVMGLDEMALCKQRLITEYFPLTSERQFREAALNIQDSGSPSLQTQESILLYGQRLIGLSGSTTNVMDLSIENNCRYRIELGLIER